MKSIVILSGKGGVGKSSIAASLAVALSWGKKIVCADCDVDASNLSLLFSVTEKEYEGWKPLSTNQAAVVDRSRCTGCGVCERTCYFDAVHLKESYAEVDDLGCEGCGACELACPENAISMVNIENANVGYARTGYGFYIASAQMMPGSSGSGKVVAEVRKKTAEIARDAEYVLIDAAAGIGCPVIASVTGNNLAIIVAEPTPAGFADMKKAFETVEHFKIKAGIIINKYNLNKEYTDKIINFAKDKKIKIFKRIGFDRNFVNAMVKMQPIISLDAKYKAMFEDIKNQVLSELQD